MIMHNPRNPVETLSYLDCDREGARVSAIITAYNRPDYLRYAIESALSQSYCLHEIIVVDDCSPSDLNAVIDEFHSMKQVDNNTLKYYRLPHNQGANAARNLGISVASGDWLAFLDDDDVWLPEKILEQMHVLLAEHSSASEGGAGQLIAGLCSYRFLESGNPRSAPASGPVELEVLKTGNPYCGASGLIVERGIARQLAFDETLPCGQDWDIYVRLAQHGRVTFLSKALFLYRRGSHDGLTTKAKSMSLSQAEQRLASTYKHREWLGERYFKRRAAGQILSYLVHKRKPLKWIARSVKIAGLRASLGVLIRKFSKRVAQVGMN